MVCLPVVRVVRNLLLLFEREEDWERVGEVVPFTSLFAGACGLDDSSMTTPTITVIFRVR